MNKLKTDNTGGVPFDWDDWRWEQEGVREAFFGILSAWGIDPSDSFIISGCTSTFNGLNYDISTGFIALGGEVYKVEAHSVIVALTAGNTHFWEVSTTFDSSGLEVTKNAGTVNTYEIRRAIVVNDTIPTPSFMPMLAETIHKKVADSVKPDLGAWIRIDLDGETTNIKQNDAITGLGNDVGLSQAPVIGSYIKYRITGKTVDIIFNIQEIITVPYTTSQARSIVLFGLPFTFKTSEIQKFTYSGESDLGGNLHGTHQGETINGTNRIVFKLFTLEGLNGSFNRLYTMSTAPIKSFSATLDTPSSTWSISGGLTAEIN